jgi:DNA-binding transcriptional LysR family regulator
MNIKYLKTFITLVDCGTYSITAQKLQISQPTVTTHIQVLETEFNNKLIQKKQNRYVPTNSGTIFLEYAEKIVALYQECHAILDPQVQIKKASIRIGTTAIDTYLLAIINRNFNFQFPGIQSFFSITNTEEAFESLRSGSVDIILSPSSPKYLTSSSFYSTFVGTEKLYLVANENNPLIKQQNLSLSAFKSEKFILRELGSDTGNLLASWLKNNHLGINKTIRMRQYDNIKKALAENMGISILPEVFFNGKTTSIKPLNVEGFPIIRNFYTTTLRSNASNEIFKIFLQTVKRSWSNNPS